MKVEDAKPIKPIDWEYYKKSISRPGLVAEAEVMRPPSFPPPPGPCRLCRRIAPVDEQAVLRELGYATGETDWNGGHVVIFGGFASQSGFNACMKDIASSKGVMDFVDGDINVPKMLAEDEKIMNDIVSLPHPQTKTDSVFCCCDHMDIWQTSAPTRASVSWLHPPSPRRYCSGLMTRGVAAFCTADRPGREDENRLD